MAVKLAIADTIGVKLEGTYRDAEGNDKKYKFTLYCDRLPQEQLKTLIGDKDLMAADFFKKHAKDWVNQRLVLTEADEPAPFSPEALDMLFTIAGMASVCWQAYLQQVVATKN